MRLVLLLPEIAESALSGRDEDRERLFRLFSDFNLDETRGIISISWIKGTLTMSKEESAFSPCMDSLCGVLRRLFTDTYWDSVDLSGLAAIVSGPLYSFSALAKDEKVSTVMFHYFLIALPRAPLDGSDTLLLDAKQVLEALFPYPASGVHSASDLLISSLDIFCDFIISKQLIGLPSLIMEHLLQRFRELLGCSSEVTVETYMDRLFRGFLQQDPLIIDPRYPLSHRDQQRSLDSLIKFVQKEHSRSPQLEDLLMSWYELIDEKCEKRDRDERYGTDSSNFSSKTRDWMVCIDLRDVLWMLEGKDANPMARDPFDLQDVIWMFEEERPLGAPVNFNYLRGQLGIGRALAPRKQDSDRLDSDVGRLFDDAPCEPFPPKGNEKGSN